jgi:hypothetical protein
VIYEDHLLDRHINEAIVALRVWFDGSLSIIDGKKRIGIPMRIGNQLSKVGNRKRAEMINQLNGTTIVVNLTSIVVIIICVIRVIGGEIIVKIRNMLLHAESLWWGF